MNRMEGNSRNHYETLGVSPNADQDQIRAAYRRLAKENHPDLCNDGDVATFRRAQDAYDTLRDPRARRAYDRELQQRRAYEADLSRRRAYQEQRSRAYQEQRRRAGQERRRDPFDQLNAIFEELFGFSDADRGRDYADEAGFGGFGTSGGFAGFGAFSDVDDAVYSDEGTDAGRYGRRESGYQQKTSVVEFDLHMGPDEAFTGGSAHLNLDYGRTVIVDVPPGVKDGDLVTARFRDRGGIREVRLHIRVV